MLQQKQGQEQPRQYGVCLLSTTSTWVMLVRTAHYWMEYSVGDKFITLDAPFYLNMGNPAGEHVPRDDAVHGMMVAYCFKYNLGGEHGIQLCKSGLVFWQHMSELQHTSHLSALGAILSRQMADVGTKCAMLRDGQRGSSCSSAYAPQALGNQ